jgi:uncharacterized protein (DUF2141 family)
MLSRFSTVLCFFLILQAVSSKPQNVIHVTIDGFRSDKGQAVCSLYSSAEGFPKNFATAIAHSKSSIANRHADCEFSGIQPGTYAIAVFHDENSNGKLDTDFLGIPREGVGASNNAKGHFGPPRFHDGSSATFALRASQSPACRIAPIGTTLGRFWANAFPQSPQILPCARGGNCLDFDGRLWCSGGVEVLLLSAGLRAEGLGIYLVDNLTYIVYSSIILSL